MTESPFAFSVEVCRGGRLLGSAAGSVTPCVEDARFRAALAGVPPGQGAAARPVVRPLWHASGPPLVAGLVVARGGGPADARSYEYGRCVFEPWARAIVHELLGAKRLAPEDRVEWRVTATERRLAPPARFAARAVRAPYPMRPGRLPGAARGTLAVAIEGPVLAAIRAAALASPERECAGLLVGHLLHDRARRAAALRVSGQIPLAAGCGGASRVHFSLGAESFLAARRLLATSAGGPIAAGWWHWHPPCERCPENPACQAETRFLSTDDWRVHLAAFPAAYMVALVAGKARELPATQPAFRLYGWGGGRIVERPLGRARRGPGGGTGQKSGSPRLPAGQAGSPAVR